jgi:hypothetical protein
MTGAYRAGLLAVMLVAAGCSGNPASGDSTTTAPADDEATVGPEGGTVEGPDGIALDIPAGVFDAETVITITPTTPEGLPDGAVAQGFGFEITASNAPDGLVLVEVPVPADVSRDDLYLVRIPTSGPPQIIGGGFEGDSYVAAVPGFSKFTLATYDAADLLASLGIRVDILLEVLDIPVDIADERDELYGLASGLLPAPVARSVRVIGPGEVLAGRAATFAAQDFVTSTKHLLRYAWTVSGPMRPVGPTDDPTVVLEGLSEGRAILGVDVTDPRLGVSAFASRRVFVLAPDATGLYLSPNQDDYQPDDLAAVLAVPRNMTPPFTYVWSTTNGASGVEQSAEQSIDLEIGSISSDTVLTVQVTDASDLAVEQSLGLMLGPNPQDCYIIGFAGPLTAEVGQPTAFELLTTDPVPPFTLGIRSGTGTISVAGTTVTVTFNEPGMQFVDVLGRANEWCKIWLGSTVVLVQGPIPPLTAVLLEPPAEGGIDARIELTLEVAGGIVATTEGLAPYLVTVDWGDGTSEEVTIDAPSATTPTPAVLAHTFEEAGAYAIAITVESPDGQTVVIAHEIAIDAVTTYRGVIVEYVESESDIFHVTRNRVDVTVADGEIVLDRLIVEWETRYETFTTGGDTEIADCLGVGSRSLVEADLFFNDAGRIRGTIHLRWVHDDEGPECPFGGLHSDRDWRGDVRGGIEGDLITLTLVGRAEGLAEETLTVEAPRV